MWKNPSDDKHFVRLDKIGLWIYVLYFIRYKKNKSERELYLWLAVQLIYQHGTVKTVFSIN